MYFNLDITNCALLVIDMQEYFRSIAADIIPSVQKLVSEFRSMKLPVIYTRHSHKDPAIDGGMLAQWWGDLIIDGTPEAEILKEIQPVEGEKIIHKNRYSAFFNTGLDEYLRQAGIKDVIISGVMTNLCCETTARDAFVRDYRVFFLSDGTATSSNFYQQATLQNLSFGFAVILSCNDVIDLLRRDTL